MRHLLLRLDPRFSRPLVLFACVAVLCGCRPPAHNEETADGGQAVDASRVGTSRMLGDEASAFPSALPPISLEAQRAAATLVDVQLGSWGSAPLPANFATLTVEDERGIGTPLTIESLDVNVVVEGRMARTEVTQIFRNHQGRQSEGTYEFTLPDGAAISRLAMDVDGVMTEGELVERERARRIYEDIVRRQKDPALLEWQGGNRFKTQIFPIPAQGTKTVVLAYEQLLPEDRDGARYRYALPHLQGDVAGTRIGRFRFTLTAATTQPPRPLLVTSYDAKLARENGVDVVHLSFEDFVPAGPVDVRFGPTASREPLRLRGYRVMDNSRENFFLVDFVPALPARPQAIDRDLVVALDTSAGLGDPVLDQAKLTAMLLVSKLPAGARYQIVHGDLYAAACGPTPLSSADQASAAACLEALDAGGATDLSALIGKAVDAAKTMQGPARIVLLTDGAASTGELDGDVIRARAVAALQGHDIELHTVAIGHGASGEDLAGLAAAGRGHSVRMSPSDDPAAIVVELLARATEPLLTDVHVEVVAGEVEGLTPASAVNLARGQGLAVLGRVLSDAASVRVRGLYGGQVLEEVFEVSFDPSVPESTLLTNFWARAAIGAKEAAGAPIADIVAASLKYGVMSQHTSFLVLENDQAYKRWEVERRKEAERVQRDGPQPDTTTKVVENLKKSDANLSDVLAQAAEQDQNQPSVVMRGEEDQKERKKVSGDSAGREAPQRSASALAELDDFRESEDGEGRFGFGIMGSGEDAGGGYVGGAGIGTIGTGQGHGYGKGGAKFDKSTPSTPTFKVGAPTVSGSLDKNIIRRVVQRHKRELQTCYESELKKNPHIQGEIVVKWVIKATGEVASAVIENSTMNNSAVERCITKRVMGWRFPAAKGGGIVLVKFPFHFESGSGGARVAPPTPEERVAALEKLDAPSIGEFTELLTLRLNRGEDEKAKALFEKHWSRYGQESAFAQVGAFHHPKAQALFGAAFEQAALLSAKDGDTLATQRLLHRYLESQRYDAVVEQLGALTMVTNGQSTDTARGMLTQVVNQDLATGRRLFDAWALQIDASTRLSLLSDDALIESLPEQAYGAASAWFKDAEAELWRADEAIHALVAVATKTHREAEAIGLLGKQCLARLERSVCSAAIQRFAGHPAVGPAIANLVQAELAAVADARREDIGDAGLIRRQAGLLREMGREAEASRVMSEIVEFAPHDYAVRVQYAQALSAVDDIEGACQAYASAVQLDPAQRDTFRIMMAMRRAHEDRAKAIKSCIATGVSNLPVRRAISLVMTWEDPTADVDLHILEANGEEVWYQRRESSNGGLLYYDITDGYGPEIYVLGSGPKGSYALSVVYYSGSASNVQGTLTVMENAGSAAETRREIPFTLPTANSNVKIPLGELVIE